MHGVLLKPDILLLISTFADLWVTGPMSSGPSLHVELAIPKASMSAAILAVLCSPAVSQQPSAPEAGGLNLNRAAGGYMATLFRYLAPSVFL